MTDAPSVWAVVEEVVGADGDLAGKGLAQR
jgi:hypothetical protein